MVEIKQSYSLDYASHRVLPSIVAASSLATSFDFERDITIIHVQNHIFERDLICDRKRQKNLHVIHFP